MHAGEPLAWRRLGASESAEREMFFGYYDRCPWDAAGELHLALEAPLLTRTPAPGQTATVGVVDAATGAFHALAETRAWNHQQGAMTLWLEQDRQPRTFAFNDYDPEAGRLLTRIWSVDDGDLGHYSRPLYATSPNGRLGASLDFGRIPRRGYSYADTPLDLKPPDLDGDGIWLVDLDTGEWQLAATYAQILHAHPMTWSLRGRYVWLNHIIFNSDSQRLLFLCRDCPADAAGVNGQWRTHLYTMDSSGDDLACILPDVFWRGGAISHQIWGRTPHEILVDAAWTGTGHEYVVFDECVRPPRAHRVATGLGPPGHLSFSPNGRWLLSDTYPMGEVQTVGLTRVDSGETRVLGRFRHPAAGSYPVDLRCDLHPRWSRDGSAISVDSVHDGRRAIYCLDLNSATWEMSEPLTSATT